MNIEEIKSKITSLLSDACEAHHYDTIEKLSAAYNNLCQANLCQAQKSKMGSDEEFNKAAMRYRYKSTYSMPTVDRFNNIKK